MPPTALQLAPALTSTATLTLALAAYADLWPFVHGAPAIAPAALSSWFARWFRVVVGPIAGLATASAAAGGYHAYLVGAQGAAPPLARRLSAAGAVLAAAHFAFVYPVSWKIKEIVEAAAPGARDPREPLREWLRIHTLRTFTVDVGAWLCFVAAVLRA